MKRTNAMVYFSVRRILLGLSFLIPLAVLPQTVNSNLSAVNFTVSNMKLNTVKGSFTGMVGKVFFNPANLSSAYFDVTIRTNTVNTGNNSRDEHLKSSDFFKVEKYPVIRFQSTSIIESTIIGYYIARGALTIKGIKKNIVIPFTYQNNIFGGRIKVNRLDYGVGLDTGEFMVGNEINIEIRAVLE